MREEPGTNPFAADIAAEAGPSAGGLRTNPFTEDLSQREGRPSEEGGAGPASNNPFDEVEPAATRQRAAPAPPAPAPATADAAAGRQPIASATGGGGRDANEDFNSKTLLAVPAPEIVKEPIVDMGAKPLRATVGRLTMSRSKFKWHDRRTLALAEGRVDIFGPGSTSCVKLSVSIAEDVDECTLQRAQDSEQKILFLSVRRPLRGRTADDGVKEQKLYFFEFDTAEAAAEFHSGISAARGRRGRI